MEKKKIKDKKLPVGFTFSFPCRQSKIDEVSTCWDWRAPQKPQRGEVDEPLFSPLLTSLMACLCCILKKKKTFVGINVGLKK